MTIVPATRVDVESPAPACAGLPLNLFYDRETRDEALETCADCPRKALCLNEELQRPITHQFGVRGGLTADDRKDLIRAYRALTRKASSDPALVAPVIDLTTRSSAGLTSTSAVAA